ncbi:N-glycosylase [Candidatus Pacearchaeota archaeon CG10_big_fil_rev_8_21_14_0_10_30_48]|nr:MAG: N-glycosylase [Candidatus Pacearchaeota archaeon CG10_big_fil_rev_8_21_14_0_10_30_48]
MEDLITKINALKETPIRETVEKRLKEFDELREKENDEWFSELCFCLLTANSRASSAIKIQNQIGARGFLNSPKENIAQTIKMNKHRFHNNKAKYIVGAREFKNIKEILKDKEDFEAREFIVENVKGLGMKEASHFLRNVGRKNLAILDRHILNLLYEEGYLLEKPKTLTPKVYKKIEETFNRIAERLKMSSAELDLYMWYMKTGIVLK